MMNLLSFPSIIGYHQTAWRHRDSFDRFVGNIEGYIEVAKHAERAMLDAVFVADGNAVRAMDKPALFAANFPANMTGSFEPSTLFAALSQHTSNLGFISTSTTTYEEPYLVARKYASLDMISGGRSGWNVVTSSNAGDAFNFSRTEHPDREDRYGRADEFTTVVKGLWDSWASDAFPQNKDTGQFLDPSKVRELNHVGKYFQVKGPLCASRSKQGRPVLFSAGQSDKGKELAAKHSEGVFATAIDKDTARRDYEDIKGRMARYGRDPNHLRFLPALVAYIGDSRSEAQDLFDELQSMITPEVGRQYLERTMRMDLSKYSVDDPMPSIAGEVVDGYANRTQMDEVARRERLTIRQTYLRMSPASASAYIVGTANDVADYMEDWYRAGVCDGFILSTPVQPKGMKQLADQVVPELQRRGLFRKSYRGTTLRENMGLPIPTRD
jgi:FMN-dependent oxidoreductase (nitrilotriacetate monooxygenase family)